MLYILILLATPGILMGFGPGKTVFVFKPEIPDTISGIQIHFEVKQVHVIYRGSPTSILCLCANITNRNLRLQKIQIRYNCRGMEKVRYIEIGGMQQKIILVDRCVMKENSRVSPRDYFSQVLLEYNQSIRY
jgi:hypothetical protein